MSDTFIQAANAAHTPLEVRHGDGKWRHGYATAQWRGYRAPRGCRSPPPDVVQGHLFHNVHQDSRVFVAIAAYYLFGIV
jgi:hypothetical protein